MSEIKLIKEPGYIYDLIFIFYLKFNTEYCLENFVNGNKRSDDEKHFRNIIEDFSPISDDLFVFFNAIENGQCFLQENYFHRYKNIFTNNYNFDFLQNELSKHSLLIKRLIKFYFYDMSNDDIENCINSNKKLFAYIKESPYSDKVKNKLYEFFIEPTPYIQKLQYELMAKELKLAKYYEENYKTILNVYNNLSFDTLCEQVISLKDLTFLKAANQQLYISLCLINKNCLNLVTIYEGILYLLGYDYVDIIKYLQEQKKEIKLEDFGLIVNEESRVNIINLILERGEVSCKDLEKTFDFSGSTAYHHLTTMLRVNVLKTRNEGKTILYSLNNKYFDVIINILYKYSSKGVRR